MDYGTIIVLLSWYLLKNTEEDASTCFKSVSDFSHQIHINIERLYMLLLVLVFITFNKFPLLLGQCLSGYIWAFDSDNGCDNNAEIEDRSDDEENDGFYDYYSGIFNLVDKVDWLILAIVAIIWYLILLGFFCWSRQSISPKPSQDQNANTFDWSIPSTSTIYYV